MQKIGSERPLTAVDIVGPAAGRLALVEVGLGSFLHALKVPLAGHVLSLNQIFMMTRLLFDARSVTEHRRTWPWAMSSAVAVLKSLSPAGRKLGPMVALSMQGALFTLGTFIAGPGLAGGLVGGVLASTWAFLQSVVMYYILFGSKLLDMAQFAVDHLKQWGHVDPRYIWWIIAGLFVIKAVLAAAVVLSACRLSADQRHRYVSFLLKWVKPERVSARLESQARVHWKSALRGAWSDLMTPLFLGSCVLTGAFVIFYEGYGAQVVWTLLRPLALGFMIFFSVRMISFDSLSRRLQNSRFQSFGKILAFALEWIRGHTPRSENES